MLRIGILGAAKIAPAALIKPAQRTGRATVAVVAARDPDKAQKFADKHKIPRIAPTYDALLDDPDIDAVYIPLPNGLHGRWTIAALDAGKHVLCEKPFTANADEARLVAEADAAHHGLVVMEAFHYQYHPLGQAPGRDRPLRGARRHPGHRHQLLAPLWPRRATSATSSTWPAAPPWTWAAIPSRCCDC